MFKKKTLLVAVATAIVACSAIFFTKAGNKQDALFAENVEALAQYEYYPVPCVKSSLTCKYKVMLADGTLGIMTVTEAVKK